MNASMCTFRMICMLFESIATELFQIYSWTMSFVAELFQIYSWAMGLLYFSVTIRYFESPLSTSTWIAKTLRQSALYVEARFKICFSSSFSMLYSQVWLLL